MEILTLMFMNVIYLEGRVEFKQPSQLAVCQDRLIQDVIGGEDLCRSLSLSYLHPALQSRLSSSLLTALGVHRLRAAEIITVTCSMARELVQHGSLKSGVKSRTSSALCHVVANVKFWSRISGIHNAHRCLSLSFLLRA